MEGLAVVNHFAEVLPPENVVTERPPDHLSTPFTK